MKAFKISIVPTNDVPRADLDSAVGTYERKFVEYADIEMLRRVFELEGRSTVRLTG